MLKEAKKNFVTLVRFRQFLLLKKTAIITHGEEENNDIDLNSKNRNKCLY